MADVIYTLTLTVTRPIRFDADSTLADAAEEMTAKPALRELEREVLRALRKLDGDCDVEVMEHSITKDVEEERDESYERMAARDRLDGFQRTSGKDWT